MARDGVNEVDEEDFIESSIHDGSSSSGESMGEGSRWTSSARVSWESLRSNEGESGTIVTTSSHVEATPATGELYGQGCEMDLER